MIRTSFAIEEIDWNNLEATAKRLGYDSRNKLISAIVKKTLYGDEVKTETTTKEKIEEQKLANLVIKYSIMEQELRIKTSFADYVEKYIERFGTMPSTRGLRAIGHKAKSDNQTTSTPTQKETYIPKFAITKTYGEFFGICKICPNTESNNFSATTEDYLVTLLEDHIKDEHHEVPYKKVVIAN